MLGRLSRDIPQKHHTSDAAFYCRLAMTGISVRIMGGSCLREEVSSCAASIREHIQIVPVGTIEPQSFLQNLDCFFYRTSQDWTEPFGRVVMEAMACGLPVVCANRGGYADMIQHGKNGFLFESETEAFELIQRLREDPGLRHAIGAAARESMEKLYSPARRRETIHYYCR